MFRILALRRQMLILDIAAEACPDKRRKMGEENVLDEIVEMLDATFHQSSKTLFSEVTPFLLMSRRMGARQSHVVFGRQDIEKAAILELGREEVDSPQHAGNYGPHRDRGESNGEGVSRRDPSRRRNPGRSGTGAHA